MSKTLRALTAAFVVALASLGGALYLAHARDDHPAMLGDAGSGMAALDLRALLAARGGGDQTMLDSAFRQVERTYYKPVDAQTLLGGERRELINYLRSKHIANPDIPAMTATGDETQDLSALNRDLAAAQAKYAKRTSATEITQAAIRGMLSSLGDPYTTYLSPIEINSLQESLEGGNFGGIGVYIFQESKTKQIVVQPIDGMPAARAGMKPGDRIVSVEGKPIAGLPLDDIERMLRGGIGTIVHVGVRGHASSAQRTVAITRAQIVVPSVHAERQGEFQYVRLSDFGKTSYDEVRKAMLDGKAHGAKGYILDLRNNGGGYLDAAVSISSLFIDRGTIVSTIDRAGTTDSKSAAGAGSYIGSLPLVILVNKFTASASEITAGAVQDDKVGTLVGTKTFGKGVVQSIYNTLDGGALKITTARYVTPLGRDIQHKGIVPDIVVDQSVDLPIIDTPRDLQLAAAKSYLRRTANR